MDVEDEPNCYLKYLNDSETPNAYLLENNEVGLFPVEPIFTEMEAADWSQEGFPLLLTNSLITEEECSSNSNNISNNLITSNSPRHVIEPIEEIGICLENQNNHSDKTELSSPIEDQLLLNESEVQMPKEISFNPLELQIKNEKEMVVEDCLQFSDNQQNDIIAQLQPNQNYVLIKSSHQNQAKPIQLINADGTPIPIDSSVLASIRLPITQKKSVANQNKAKTVNDLFSTVIANKCKICSFLCENLEQIKKHISSKHPEFMFTHNGLSNGVSILLSNVGNKNPQNSEVNKEFTIYVCSECHGVCTDKRDLKNHMIQMHGLATEPESSTANKTNEIKPAEDKPKKTYSYLDDLNVSLVKKQERSLQQVKCSVKGCSAGFPSEELRKKHEKLHVGDTKSMFKCTECDKTFMMWTVARSHLHNDHGIDFGMIVCPMCNIFKSYRPVRVLKHMIIHSGVKPFLCSDCGKSFRQLAQLKNHEVLHKLPEDMPTWSKVKKCDKCQRFFANSKSLKTHIKTVHENIKPFICNICGHKSSRKAMLELHTRQHTASKPHKCEYCDFRTGDPNSLRKHIMKHVGAVTYQCPYCPYKCIQAGSIKSHFIRRHKDKAGVYFCKHCSYTTINETFLKAHEKNHDSSSKDSNNHVASDAERNRTNDNDLQTDEETQSCFLNTESQIEETVDNGGITIPAGLEMPLVS